MERYRRIYYEALTLFEDVPRSRKLGYSMAFNSKMASFEIMYKETLKKVKTLESVAKEEKSEDKVAMTRTTRAWYEAIAFFEAYLNSFYSLLQIIAKFTPLFYGKDKDIPDDNFGEQVNFFIAHPKLNPEFSSYLIQRLTWYKILRNNRHAITHRLSAFLGLDKDGRIVFIDYPQKDFDWFGKKSTRDMEMYLSQSFNDLFDLLEFYAQHFRKRVPKSNRTKLILRSISQANTEH